ncbi:MAG: hypothetical protein AAF709_23670, partial [Pseudomonadota bacterium]
IMRERGDLDVLHEPFMYHHYLDRSDRLFADFEPEPGHPKTYEEIREMIVTRSEARPVFFKDMAYYIAADLPNDPEFSSMMTHAFLVRDPAEAILSYHRREPAFSCEELGLMSQFALYTALIELGQTPLVLTADQLRSSPEATLERYWSHVGLPFAPHAFSWEAEVPEDWQSVAAWHDRAVSSGRIEPVTKHEDTLAVLERLGPPYTAYDRHHRPAYEALRDVARLQAQACT